MLDYFLRTYNFGTRIYAHKKWWTLISQITRLEKGTVYLVTEKTTAPSQVQIIVQSEEDKQYQKILFRKF